MRASETDRSLACPASLIQIGTRTRNEKAEASAAWGSLVHHWKETGETDPPWASEKDIACLEKKLLLSGTEREKYWWLEDGEHEVSFAVQLDDLTVLTYDEYLAAMEATRYPQPWKARDEWKAGFDAEWLTGTIDWLHWGTEDTVPWVDDLKTGHWPIDPRKAGQLRSYALLPWVLQGCPVDWECAISVTKWERYPLDGLPTRSAHRINGLDMIEHLEALRYAAKHPEEVVPLAWDTKRNDWVVGEQCTFCANRQEHFASSWMTHWKFSRHHSCWEGIKRSVVPLDEDD